MKVTHLKLANLRAIEAAEFKFQSGFNLIVGVNGAGKTSVLDALCACLSPIVKQVNHLGGRALSLSKDDIRVGADALTMECRAEIGGKACDYFIHLPREASVPQSQSVGMPREQVYATPPRSGFLGETPRPLTSRDNVERPLALMFATRRAVSSDRAPSKGATAGSVKAAFAEALADRELRLGEFASWMRVQEVLSDEKPGAANVLKSFSRTVRRFLPGYSGLRVIGNASPKLLIDHEGIPIEVRQLSDGERGAIALVFDLTRRLAQANPGMSDPAAEAEAIVLIDEIDLHLHPKWQRQIVRNLTSAFPRCQFIATTHSPQVIGEVEHDRIQIIANGQVYSPTHSYGVDSSRVLEEIMDADPRAHEVNALLSQISKEVGKHRYESARELLARLIGRLGEDDPEVTRIRTLLDFMEGEQ